MIHESPDGGKTIKSREMNLPKGSNDSQTAVELLFQKLWDTPKDKFTWYAILEQAKEMEKQQIIDAYNNGDLRSADLYYDETYGSKRSDEFKGGELATFKTSSQTEIEKSEKPINLYDLLKKVADFWNRSEIPKPIFKQYLSEHNLDEITTSSQTEISDEEIEKFASDFYDNNGADEFIIMGAKWYREQLKKKQ